MLKKNCKKNTHEIIPKFLEVMQLEEHLTKKVHQTVKEMIDSPLVHTPVFVVSFLTRSLYNLSKFSFYNFTMPVKIEMSKSPTNQTTIIMKYEKPCHLLTFIN